MSRMPCVSASRSATAANVSTGTTYLRSTRSSRPAEASSSARVIGLKSSDASRLERIDRLRLRLRVRLGGEGGTRHVGDVHARGLADEVDLPDRQLLHVRVQALRDVAARGLLAGEGDLQQELGTA